MQTISLANLAVAFLPVLAVVFILYQWSLGVNNAVYALLRMLVQLLLAGYMLTYIFAAQSSWIVLAVLAVMVLASGQIALNTIKDMRWMLYKKAALSLLVGGGFPLLVISQGVLSLKSWYAPQYIVPLGGMAFANAMTSVSLAAERLHAEMSRGLSYVEARKTALRTALIPVINSLFAVGLVSLPGMMTGQILSGISPPIAARYQIMAMCLIFSASGISAAVFLTLVRADFCKRFENTPRSPAVPDGKKH
ncbi:MAG: ABC transporter permease [Candidatus Zeuxoniibacter abyssi]|nr:MAG: ABC transporter permease [Candidatus Persebacteraceae bacterium AB1(2)]